jgi:hypothetical protein
MTAAEVALIKAEAAQGQHASKALGRPFAIS